MYAEAKDTFETVRDWYRGENSLKSANKYYDVNKITAEDIRDKHDNSISKEAFIKKALSANQRRAFAETELLNAFSMDPAHGMPRGDDKDGIPQIVDRKFAANCQQLTLACCSYARNKHLITREAKSIWVVNLKKMDHCFCMIGANFGKFNNLQFSTLEISAIATELHDTYAVDVWMNIFCLAHKYRAEADAKLTRWAGRGKQVLEAGSLFGPDMPDYKKRFRDDSISVAEF